MLVCCANRLAAPWRKWCTSPAPPIPHHPPQLQLPAVPARQAKYRHLGPCHHRKSQQMIYRRKPRPPFSRLPRQAVARGSVGRSHLLSWIISSNIPILMAHRMIFRHYTATSSDTAPSRGHETSLAVRSTLSDSRQSTSTSACSSSKS